MYKDYVEQLARALVTDPEQVVVETTDDPTETVIKLRVAPGDLGRVIGKDGRTAKAIRTLLHAMAARHQHRVKLQIVEYGNRAGRSEETF